MKFSMSFALLLPMLFAAAPSRALSIPMPGNCPAGMQLVYDEFQRRYVCVPKPPEPAPLPWCGERMKELKETLGGDDTAAKGDALRALWGDGKAKSLFKTVQDTTWGGPTGRPPETPGWKLQPREPQRPEPRQEPQRQEPQQRQPPPENLRLPPSVIPANPGTIRPA